MPAQRSSRPISVTVIGGLFILVGVIGLIYHLFIPLRQGFRTEDLWIEITEALALLFGVFLLRGRSWARWGVLGWMGFHVGLSVFDRMRGLAVHILFLLAFAYLLFRADAAEYFRSPAETE
jgi:hypothetical protein